MLTPNDVVELSPQSPGHGGIAVARHDGQAVFVRGALPGETVRARITEVKKSYARASTVEVRTASAHRVPESCPAAAAGAGCCDLTIATPEYQRTWKTEVLADLLVRFGRFAPGELAPTVGEITPGLTTGWRHRARLHAAADGTLGWRGARSHDLVDASGCAQLPTGLTEGLRATPDDEVAVVLDDDGARHAVAGGTVLDGTGMADYRIGGTAWRLPAGSFWQAHRDAAAHYSALVDRWTADLLADGTVDTGARAWDLYGGAGVFAAVLAERGLTVDVVETAREAIAAGRDALDGSRVRFHRGDVARTVGRLRAPGLVVLDPPRSGAGKAVIAAIVTAAPRAVIHVGCDPAAFARDLALFRDAGYAVREAVAVDAFPGTHHLECLAVLTTGSAP